MSKDELNQKLENMFLGSFNRRIFIWTSSRSKDGVTYGSYKYLTKADLEGRTYELSEMDGLSIQFTDCEYNPKTYKVERK